MCRLNFAGLRNPRLGGGSASVALLLLLLLILRAPPIPAAGTGVVFARRAGFAYRRLHLFVGWRSICLRGVCVLLDSPAAGAADPRKPRRALYSACPLSRGPERAERRGSEGGALGLQLLAARALRRLLSLREGGAGTRRACVRPSAPPLSSPPPPHLLYSGGA